MSFSPSSRDPFFHLSHLQVILLLDPETRMAQPLIDAHLSEEPVKVLDQVAINTIVGMMAHINDRGKIKRDSRPYFICDPFLKNSNYKRWPYPG